MKAQERNRERTTLAEDIRQIASLATAVRVICMAHQLTLREQSLTVARDPLPTVEIDVIGPQPFGFAFTAGHEAAFHVPSGHRFVIEHMNVSCWARNDRVDVQLVTRSPHMFRSLTVTDWPRHASSGEEVKSPSVAPIQVHGSSANSFLFSNGELHSSSTVPPDTYVQVWGYLEPAYEPEGL